MIEAEINLWAVLVAGVVSMAIGAVWYNVFSKQWLKGVGLTEKQVRQGSKLPYAISFVSMLVISYMIANVFFYVYAGDGAAVEGALTGFYAWLGFAATVTAINYAYQFKSFKLYAIDAGYSLVFFVVSGAIIGGWQ